MAKVAIDYRLTVDVVTRWGIERAQAREIVRHVLEEVVADLRRCREVTVDPDLRMGVGVAIARLRLSATRIGEAPELVE